MRPRLWNGHGGPEWSLWMTMVYKRKENVAFPPLRGEDTEDGITLANFSQPSVHSMFIILPSSSHQMVPST